MSLRDPEREKRIGEQHWATVHGERLIVQGALQIAASKLVCQLTQERAGDSELYQGLNILEDHHRAEREKRTAAERESRAQARARAKKPKTPNSTK